jgi:hypothetical protein
MEMFWILWLLFAGLIAMWADTRGRSWAGFFLVSFFGSPLLAGVILLVTKDLKEEALQEEAKKQEQKKADEMAREERAREHERQIEALQAIRTPAASTAAGASVIGELERLGNLLERGLLTEEEFKAQKAQLLSKQ